jgi:hypothetical protein
MAGTGKAFDRQAEHFVGEGVSVNHNDFRLLTQLPFNVRI